MIGTHDQQIQRSEAGGDVVPVAMEPDAVAQPQLIGLSLKRSAQAPVTDNVETKLPVAKLLHNDWCHLQKQIDPFYGFESPDDTDVHRLRIGATKIRLSGLSRQGGHINSVMDDVNALFRKIPPKLLCKIRRHSNHSVLQIASREAIGPHLKPLPAFGFKLRRAMTCAYTGDAHAQQIGQSTQYVLFLSVSMYDVRLKLPHELPEFSKYG